MESLAVAESPDDKRICLRLQQSLNLFTMEIPADDWCNIGFLGCKFQRRICLSNPMKDIKFRELAFTNQCNIYVSSTMRHCVSQSRLAGKQTEASCDCKTCTAQLLVWSGQWAYMYIAEHMCVRTYTTCASMHYVCEQALQNHLQKIQCFTILSNINIYLYITSVYCLSFPPRHNGQHCLCCIFVHAGQNLYTLPQSKVKRNFKCFHFHSCTFPPSHWLAVIS